MLSYIKRKMSLKLLIGIILIFLLIWHFWPQKKIIKYLPIEVSDSPILQNAKCEKTITLINQQWILSYPHSVELNQPAEVIFSINPQTTNEQYEGSIDDVCDVFLEARIELDASAIEPGKRIIKQIKPNTYDQFSWKIYPLNKKKIEGVLWINLQETMDSGDIAAIPVYALPISIEQISILSVAPAVIRLILFALLVTGGLVSVLFF